MWQRGILVVALSRSPCADSRPPIEGFLAARLVLIVRRIALLAVIASAAGLMHPLPPVNAQQRPTVSPTPDAAPESGNDTVKLAAVGVVFLLIGAVVVYAPQIVSALAPGTRRAKRRTPGPAKDKRLATPKEEPPERPAPPTEQPAAPTVTEPQIRLPERDRLVVSADPQPDDVVSRLQTEVRSAWSKNR